MLGIGSSRLNAFWKVVLGGIGFTALRSLFTEETLIDRLIDNLDEVPLTYADINRVIFQGNRDNIVRKLPKNIPGATYYEGDYTHSEVGSLSGDAADQIYVTNHFGSPLKLTKSSIFKGLIEP